MSCTPRSGSKRRPGNVCHAKTITCSLYKKTLKKFRMPEETIVLTVDREAKETEKRMHTGKIKSPIATVGLQAGLSVRRGLMMIQSTTRRSSTAKSPMISRQCSGGSVVAVRCGLVVTVRTWANKRLSSFVTSACKLSCLQF